MTGETVRFKSTPVNWVKGRDGRKPNTTRSFSFKECNDKRLESLAKMVFTRKYGFIEMENAETGQVFKRRITDVTEWGFDIIISWKHQEGDTASAVQWLKERVLESEPQLRDEDTFLSIIDEAFADVIKK